MGVNMPSDGVQVALPERLEGHAIGGLGAFEEARDVKSLVRSEDRPDPRASQRKISKIACLARRGRSGRRLLGPRLDPCIRIGRLQDRLLLVARALTEHAVKAQP